MTKKIALVTGASSGFGKEIALELSKQGFHVFAAGRRMELLKELATKTIEPIELDVRDEKSAKHCVEHIIQSKGKIDLLVNNAGHGLYSTIEEADIADVEHQFDVNVFGVVRMIQAVLPFMRAQHSGMIINISSVAGLMSMPLFGFYSGSKHALEAISDALRMEATPFGIKTVIIEPGVFKTNFRENALKTSHKYRDTDVYSPYIENTLSALSKSYDNAPHPEEVGKLVGKIVHSKRPKRRYVIGKGSKLFMFAKQYFGYTLLDYILLKRFWRK